MQKAESVQVPRDEIGENGRTEAGMFPRKKSRERSLQEICGRCGVTWGHHRSWNSACPEVKNGFRRGWKAGQRFQSTGILYKRKPKRKISGKLALSIRKILLEAARQQGMTREDAMPYSYKMTVRIMAAVHKHT